jgi:hypothetical protein
VLATKIAAKNKKILSKQADRTASRLALSKFTPVKKYCLLKLNKLFGA